MRLTARQQKMLQPMVVYGSQIHHYRNDNGRNGFWDNDRNLPVRIGPTLKSLIQANLVEREYAGTEIHIYRATAESKLKYECDCTKGELFDRNNQLIGTCPKCYQGCRRTPCDSDGD
jgi:hypothetical protein